MGCVVMWAPCCS